jgi:serine/threonine-protein kinase
MRSARSGRISDKVVRFDLKYPTGNPMGRCPSCSQALAQNHRFCPSCGASVDVSETPTGTAPRPATPASRAGRRTPVPSSLGLTAGGDGRFVPGTVLAARYRVVGLLGKGGMGEVYRADDLTLGYPVALKFLPTAVEGDAERLERFFSEVRIARQVTHPAVCRVYDIGEADGEHFLSMEYVDGENLATLLRRIGRLGGDKALDIARQICAGLGAAHDKGVLHRDLKPENVMLDGQGKVRITDFGLAGLADSIRGDDVRSGTPAYMSPEQLTGREVTSRSDVYSLGLVLYELFTGKKAFEGKTFSEMLKKHRDERPPDPSTLVPNLDPAVEGTILRCIAKDSTVRPPSALAVAALLPGGDPLTAAIAAGITPSPEMVAAAGEAEGLSPRAASLCLAVVLAGVVLAPVLAAPLQLFNRVPVEKAPAVLEDRARELIKRLTAGEEPEDSAAGLDADSAYFRHVRESDSSPGRWDSLGLGDPPVVGFYFRQSLHPLISTAPTGQVSWTNPPIALLSGNAGVRLDMRGRLLSFYSIPPQVESEEGRVSETEWSSLLAETGLDVAKLRTVPSRWTPPFYVDTRVAWEGTYPNRPDIPIRIEAAAYRGRPAVFYVVAPWTRPERMQPRDFTRRQLLGFASVLVVLVGLLVTGGVLARRNLRLGRGDRRGAFRVAAYAFVTVMATWACKADHVAEITGETSLVMRGVGFALFLASTLWLFYMALEPYVRRLRPQTLISWTRLLSGGFRHPIVGRDALIGATWGAACAILVPFAVRVPAWLEVGPADILDADFDVLLGPRRYLAFVLGNQIDALFLGLGALLTFLVFRLLLKRDIAGGVALTLVLIYFQLTELEANLWVRLTLGIVLMAAYVLLLLRLGLLSAISGLYVSHLLTGTPFTTHLGSWYAGPTVATAIVVGVLGIYTFRTATTPARRS